MCRQWSSNSVTICVEIIDCQATYSIYFADWENDRVQCDIVGQCLFNAMASVATLLRLNPDGWVSMEYDGAIWQGEI